jgi:single-stranded DNA-binding protein
MIEGLIAGKVAGAPEARKGKGDSPFVVARVRAHSTEGEAVWVNVIAFAADVCAALMALQEGDPVSLAGSLSPRVWSDKQGNTRPALDMVAQRVLALSPESVMNAALMPAPLETWKE